MRVLAFHRNEEIASLLTTMAMITEVDVISVPTFEKFREYLMKYDFNCYFLATEFFIKGLGQILYNDKTFPAVLIFLDKEEDLPKFLRLGVTEGNIERIPFNPLQLFVKTKGLIEVIKQIENKVSHHKTEFNFYKEGLFNVLNVLFKLKFDGFLTVKDPEEDKKLYSLRLRHGKVVSASVDPEDIVKINLDDAIPKVISTEPTTHEDYSVYQDTLEFYSKLIEIEVEEQEVVKPVSIKGEASKPKFINALKENPVRERRVYSFPMGNYTIYTQPLDTLKNLPPNSVVVISLINEMSFVDLRSFLMKNPSVKFFTSELLKHKLLSLGFKEYQFIELKEVYVKDLPFLGNKYESVFLFPNGVLVSGNLFGSYVSKEMDFLDRITFSHLRLFHLGNISSKEKLNWALDEIKEFLKVAQYIIPTYGYPIDPSLVDAVVKQLRGLDYPSKYTFLHNQWQTFASNLQIQANNYEEFLKKLYTVDKSKLFAFIGDMEALGITPLEL